MLERCSRDWDIALSILVGLKITVEDYRISDLGVSAVLITTDSSYYEK